MATDVLSNNPHCNPHCGACHYKSHPYLNQLEKKQSWALKQLGNWEHCLGPIRSAPETEQLAYRSKSWMRVHFEGKSISFGMLRSVRIEGKWDFEFVSWDTCPLHVPAIPKMIARIKDLFFREKDLFEWAKTRLQGMWWGSPHLVWVTNSPDLGPLQLIHWSSLLEAPFDQVWFHCNPQVGRKIFSHHPIHSLLSTCLSNSENTQPTASHPIRAFRQVAQSLLKEARLLAIEAIRQAQPDWVLDLYCGTGELSLLLPESMGWIGIELSQEAGRYAGTLRPQGKTRHQAFVGKVEHRLRDPQVLNQFTGSYVLYLNPPRSGLGTEAREQILSLLRRYPPRLVIYLSCSASSLARDLDAFSKENYQIQNLQPYDFFPQTEHFETLAILKSRIIY